MRLIHTLCRFAIALGCTCVASEQLARGAEDCPDLKGVYYRDKNPDDSKRLDYVHSYWVLPVKGIKNIDSQKTIDNLKSNGFTEKYKPRLVCKYSVGVFDTARECLNTITNAVISDDARVSPGGGDPMVLPQKDGELFTVRTWLLDRVWNYSVSCKKNQYFTFDLYSLTDGEGQSLPFILLERKQHPIIIVPYKPVPNL